jgi:hypothetical protein
MSSYVGSFRFKNVPHRVSFGHNVDEMSTAIVSTCTDEGFVIGADGLCKDVATGLVVTQTAQKIFPFKRSILELVFSWSGSSRLFRPDGVTFDFAEATKTILNHIDLFSADGFAQFVALFSEALYAQLAMSFGRVFHAASLKPEIARLLFVGYFRGKPYKARISVPLLNSVILQPVIEEIGDCFPGDLEILSGSKWVYQEFFESKPIMANINLPTGAMTFVQKYIQKCIDHQDKDPDCSNIGGHIHVGMLTPDGFHWIIEPKPESHKKG